MIPKQEIPNDPIDPGASLGFEKGCSYWYKYFLTAGNTASAKGASLYGFLGATCSPRKC